MPRTADPIATRPTRKTPAPSARRRVYTDAAVGYLPSKAKTSGSFSAASDDPLDALAAEVLGKNTSFHKPVYATVTAHGKPVGGIEVFGERRAPARRAAFRQPPR